MLKGYNDFKSQYDKCINFKIKNKCINEKIKSFHFLQILKTEDESVDHEIFNSIKKSKVIVIDMYSQSNYKYYIICFDEYLLIIDQSDLRFNEVFSNENKNKIYYVPNIKPNSISNNFGKEINNLSDQFTISSKNIRIIDFWKIIRRSISGYLIKNSYLKHGKDRVKEFKSYEIKLETLTEDEFINLRNISSTLSSAVFLYYHIMSENIFAVKVFFLGEDNEILKKREIENYTSLSYPFIPKYYGLTKNNDAHSLVIEFIDGETLNQSLIYQLSFEKKVKIIIEILYTIQYLHKNNFIYRDFKLDNFIIDKNCHKVLIDFDRMIKHKENDDETKYTHDFNSPLVDQDLNDDKNKPSFKNDICSIGKLIHCIFIENDKYLNDSMRAKINEIYKECISKNINENPSISNIIFNFCVLVNENGVSLNDIIDDFRFFATENDSLAQTFLGMTYCNGNHVKKNIDQAIHYFTLAADQNDEVAQFNLGQIYYDEQFKRQDIEKAIHYYTKAADQNNPNAQTILGNIYFENQLIKRDINKAIHYFSLAADQNQPIALANLAFFYFEGKHIARDLRKSIHYFELAAKLNDAQAQHFLGLIYSKKEYNMIDIQKAIQYFTQASTQNLPEAQFNLGQIFLNGKYIKRDINKSIQYFTLAANQNHQKAQFYLGVIYLDNKYIEIDTIKGFYYLSLSAGQNDKYSQNILGNIFYEGKYTKKDVNKAIYYFSLAANQNFPPALNSLGMIYFVEKSIKQDINKAIEYFQLAANQNYPNAQDNLGYIYYEGKYVQQNVDKAIFYFTQAAEQNFLLSQYNLGYIFYEGKYVTRDIDKSIHYLTLAANRNFPLAQDKLGLIYYEGQYLTRDINKALYYLTLASNQNDSNAQNILGFIYFEGKHVKRDIEKAVYYLKLAANKGSPVAQNNLGFIYYKSKFISQDINKALFYFSKAAVNGFPIAQFNLGAIYYNGKYVPKNITKSLYYLELSAKEEFRAAQLLLGNIYFEGKYVKRDIQKVIFLYKEVANINNQFAKNNLGVIYKNGVDNINKNVFLAKEYFKEAIYQKNDYLSMFNLANLLFDEEEQSDKDHNESIKYLIKSSLKFLPSLNLFFLILIKDNGLINLKIIDDELIKHNINTKNVATFIREKFGTYFKLQSLFLNSPDTEKLYKYYRNADYVYINTEIINLKEMSCQFSFNINENLSMNINEKFYEGFQS